MFPADDADVFIADLDQATSARSACFLISGISDTIEFVGRLRFPADCADVFTADNADVFTADNADVLTADCADTFPLNFYALDFLKN